MITLPGYQIIEEIKVGVNTVIYRGFREPDHKSVIIKILKNEYPTLEEIARLRHEYKITNELDLSGIVKPLSLENHKNSLALILEDFGGQSLQQFIASKQLNLIEFLQIALHLARILISLHKNKIIHKDIKPSNIIINAATEQVKITDFSIASRLDRENQTISNPNLLEGSLTYMSPEQTGRMNRAIDYRTDFYSLGVTFYEMLTGQLPFQATDPLELVHCHIAKQPMPPQHLNPEIPLVVCDIVMKLLSKTAESRYQSAEGLSADLEQCLSQLQATGKISHFQIGQQDKSGQLLIPQKLYGREAQVVTLMDAFERVSLGTTEMMLVSGYSGIGKSSLVNEVHKPIVRQRGYFIAGKFDQFKRNIPYASLIQAFQDLMRQLLTESDEKIAVWKSKLLEAFGQQGRVIIDVIPEVELIVGKQPAVPELGATEAQNRFNLVFKQFIHVFTKKEHPLVLFLDDLQWAGSASLNLIELLMSDPDSQYLLLIGAYRDNEVGAAHPLMQTLNNMHSYGVRVNTIALRPLEVAHVNQLIADTLGYEPARTEPLSELVLNKTQGNPFFLTQLLQSLYQDKLLTFDFQSGCWQWNLEQIQGMEISDNVVELMVSRIQKLAESTQQVLKLAACIGNRFDLDALALVSEKSKAATAADLWSALQVGLILPLSDAYKIPQVLDQFDELMVSYKFLHDRVQQAAYTLIPEDKKKETHLKVGQLLLQTTKLEELEEKIFDIVNHLNVSAELITSQVEKYELSKLNLAAGKKAKFSTAYASALKYVTLGIEILPENIWLDYYELAFSLYKERSECEYLCGNFEQAEKVFDILLNKARTTLEKADVYNIQMVMYSNLNKYADSINLGWKGLKIFGLNLPETPEQCQTAIAAELRELKSNLNDRKIAALIHLPQMTNLDKKACMSLLMNLELPAYQTNPALLSWVTLKMVNLSLTYGNTDLSSLAYVMYGAMLGSELGDYSSGYEFGKLALELNEKFKVIALVSKINHIFCEGINHWFKHIKSSYPFLKKAYRVGLESGDLLYAGFAFGQVICDRIIKGDDVNSIYEESEKCISFYRQTKDETMLDTAKIWQHLCLNLQGLTKNKYILSTELFDEIQHLEKLQKNGSYFGLTWYYLIKFQILFIYGNYADAMNIAIIIENRSAIPGHISIVEHCFYYSLTTAALYFVGSAESQKILYWKILEKNQVRMKKWADNCPENFLHKYLLVAAEMARISGQDLEAMKLYDQAITSAQANEYTQNAAIGNELAAKFYLARGFDTIARTYMMSARYGYAKWGATAKVKDLESRYPQLLSRTPAREVTGIESTKTTIYTTGGDARVLDLTTVVKASLALSSEMILGRLLDKLMKIMIENAGAQTGFFIAKKGNQLVIEAEGAVNKDSVTVLQSIPIEASRDLPISIIKYVERTKENLVLDDATRQQIFANDPYIVLKQPRSILCLPIIYQGKLTGILYLENNLTKAAFTPERLEVLKLLTSQVSISIENARLYTNLQTYSQELEVKNTALEQSEAQMRAQALQLEAANKELEAFSYSVSHDLRAPLRAINGFSRILLNEYAPQLAPEARRYLLLVKDNAQQMGCLVDDLLTFSRLGRSPLKKQLVHPCDLVRQTLASLGDEQQGRQVEISLGELPTVHADPALLKQVWVNLLANALKFTRQRQVARIEIGYQLLDSDSVYFVKDNGVGFNMQYAHKLFGVFQRLHRAEEYEGTGVGLAIVQRIIHRHGGRVWADAQVNIGATFYFTLGGDIPDERNRSRNPVSGRQP